MKSYNDDDDLILEEEREKDEMYSKNTFRIFWTLSALSTFLFGMSYLSTLIRMLLRVIPMSDGLSSIIAQVGGGCIAVLLLEYGYLRWQGMGDIRKCSVKQIDIAYKAERISFIVGLSYTVLITLTSITSNYIVIPEWLLKAIEVYALVSITYIFVMHIYMYKSWREASPIIASRRSNARRLAMMQSQKLAWQNDVSKLAVGEMTKKLQDNSKAVAGRLADLWSEQIVQPQLPQLPQPIYRGGYSEPQTELQSPQAEPQSSVTFTPDEPTATIDVSGDTERFR